MGIKGFDWDKFRVETAAKVLAGFVGTAYLDRDEKYHEVQVRTCIQYTDELIRQLKEE